MELIDKERSDELEGMIRAQEAKKAKNSGSWQADSIV